MYFTHLHKGGQQLKKDVLGVYRAFWIDAMHLVTRVRDTSEVEALGATILASHRRCAIHVGMTSAPPAGFIEVVMGRFVLLLTKCAILGGAAFSTAKFSTRGHWPTGIDDLLPHGPDQSTRGLISWLLHCDEVAFYELFYCLLVLAPTHAATETLRHRHALMSTLCTRFITDVSRLQHSDSDTTYNLTERLEVTSRIIETLDQWPPNMILEHLRYLEKMTFAVIENFYHFEDTKSRLVILSRLTSHFRSSLPVTADGRVAWDNVVRAFPPEFRVRYLQQDPYILFRNGVLRPFGRAQCDATGCNRYGAVEGIKLQKCTGCRIAFYCSRECQTAHWRAAIHPHKALCTIMKKVRQAADDDLPDEQYTAACVAAGISVSELVYGSRLFTRMTDQPVPDELQEV